MTRLAILAPWDADAGIGGGFSAGRCSGFTMMSMLFILVVLAALGVGLASMSQRQQLGSAGELAASRAYQAAYAGLEWASFQVLRNPAPPAAAPACFAPKSFVVPGALSDFTVTLTCVRTPSGGTVTDGGDTLVFYQVLATACNAPLAGACPNTGAPQATYAERQLSRTLSR